MMRGAKPQPTGIFDTKAVIPPTQFSEMYTTGRIPARVEVRKPDEIEEPEEEEEEEKEPKKKKKKGKKN